MDPVVTTFAVALAGGLGIAIVQGVKALAQASGHTLEDTPALVVTVVVSFLLAILAMAVTGAFNQPLTWNTVGGYVTAVFTVATLIYKTIVAKMIEKQAEKNAAALAALTAKNPEAIPPSVQPK